MSVTKASFPQLIVLPGEEEPGCGQLRILRYRHRWLAFRLRSFAGYLSLRTCEFAQEIRSLFRRISVRWKGMNYVPIGPYWEGHPSGHLVPCIRTRVRGDDIQQI